MRPETSMIWGFQLKLVVEPVSAAYNVGTHAHLFQFCLNEETLNSCTQAHPVIQTSCYPKQQLFLF